MRRLAYRIGGKKEKFEEEATKEEQEWLDAAQAELKARRTLGRVKVELAEAEKTNAELLAAAKIRNKVQVEMDELYNSLFEGPTPECPEEDAKENEVQEAQRHFDIVQLEISTEKQALEILRRADNYLNQALEDVGKALHSNELSMWGIGGTWVDMAETNSPSRAQSEVHQVQRLLQQAQQVQPEAGHVGQLGVAQMDFLSNIIFQNIFTNLSLRGRIYQSQNQLVNGKQSLVAHINASNERLRRVQAEGDQAKSVLEGKREELKEIRRVTFDCIARGLSAQDLPPAYQAKPAAQSVA